MTSDQEPLVLELAPLPRDQVGPFLLLGLDKDATAPQIEAHWAQRVLWARKGRIRTPLEDINWAREALRDADQRAGFEAASLNVVLSDGYVHQLAEKFGVEGRPGTQTRPLWEPLDDTKTISAAPNLDGVPSPQELWVAITLPELVPEFPAVVDLLKKAVEAPIDPWSL